MADHRAAYLHALLERDSARARSAVDAALADGVPIPDVYIDVLQPALYEIGHRWAVDELNVAEEHYATAVTQRLLDELGARMRRPARDGRLAVVTATPGELHALGARMVADFLEAADLAALVDRERPDSVALSTSTAGSLPGVVETLEHLRRLRPPPLLVVGGQFWTAETSAAAQELGADVVVRDLRALVGVLRERVAPASG
jgi:methanogenic corrinoid protein MtbC1